MAPQAIAPGQAMRAGREPLFDVHPQTGACIEVFNADRKLETFGRCGAGWFWWSRQRGHPPDGLATGPFPTSYAAYRHAMTIDAKCTNASRTAHPISCAKNVTWNSGHSMPLGWKA
jgi:hypothetical protein